ncbi:MAG: glycosyltransferase family 39 protein [Anaerolineales bacterium]|nr:glycosyltransferase family 39 protein [Anaerolineales bacterium]
MHQWELLLTVTALGLVIYLFFAAPAQLTGKVAIEPNQPGRPFYSLHWIREYLSDNYNLIASFSNILSGLIALTLLLAASLHRSPAKLRFSLLWGLISLAGSAQWMLSSERQFTAGLILYVIAGLGVFLWSGFFSTSVEWDLHKTSPISLRWEIVLVFITLALATFGRMYYLKSIPYGIEGDEAKWTAEVVSLGIRGEPDKLGMYHRDALPTSFYMQTLFHKLFGPSIITARFEVAFFSILATFFFYLLLRQITIIPLALLATWFLSGSIFDISASRLAHVESHVKLWPILTLALLAWAMSKKRWQAYTIAGIALAIGLLTYDTVWPILPVVFLIAAFEFWQNKDKFVDAFRNLIALLTPSTLAMPLLIPYIATRMSYYLPDGRPNDIVSLWEYFTNILFSWYAGSFNDFLYNRSGPLLNSFLLPWMTFGLIVALTTLRRRLSYWTLIWAFLFIIPVPMAANSPFGRVYYPALPAVYVLVGIGMYIVGQESLRALGQNFRPLVIAATFLVLVWVPLFNLFIYFNEVEDYDDRQIRREAAELAGAAAGADTLLILAVIPQADEPLNNEYQMIELFMLDKLPGNQIADSYKYMALEDVLPSLSTITTRSNISIILDKVTASNRQKRNDLANTLQTCYPQASWVKGFFFDRVDLNSDVLSSPACISTTLSMEYTSANTIHWELGQGTASGLSLKCEDQKTFHEYVEAETIPSSPGWGIETAIAHGWTDEGFIMDNYGSTPISFNFTLTEEKPVYIWVRSYKRAVDNYPAQITIFNQTFIFGAADEHKLNQWNWERLGPFIIPSGLNEMHLDRPYLDDPNQFMAIFVDAIILTADPNFTPAKDRELEMQTHIFNFLREQEEGDLTLSLEPGSYRCYAKAFSKQPLVDAFGHTPLTSDIINFTIAP